MAGKKQIGRYTILFFAEDSTPFISFYLFHKCSIQQEYLERPISDD